MHEMERVRLIRPAERTEGAATSGMTREEAIATGGMWGGFVRTEPGMVSGWHHHGDYETTIYVLSGAFRMESGPGGRDVEDARPGDFLHVPKGVIHREGNPATELGTAIVVRAGHGEQVFNAEGPEPE